MTKEKAFKKMYDTYWYQLYTYAYSIVRNKETSEDIIQEVFVDVWDRWETLEINFHKAYLYKAVKFQLAKKLKQNNFNEVQIEKIEYALTYLEEEASNAENVIKLYQKVNQKAKEILPEKCYLIYKLRYHENLSYQQIASKLNISQSTVDNQLVKAKQLLKASNIKYEAIIALSILLISIKF